MDRCDELFLKAMAAGSRGEKLAADPAFDSDLLRALLKLSAEQEVLPLVCDAVWGALRPLDREERKQWRERAVTLAVRQAMQTNEFLTLMLHANEAGLDATVLKGITVRQLYPTPILRPSVDEDLLVPEEDVPAWHEFLLSEGLVPDEPYDPREPSYHRPDSPTYIEIHTKPFPDSKAYGDCNTVFEGAQDRRVIARIEDVDIRTLCPTDHLLYLILHAYKHFLHGGVGVRQACDICMFAERFSDELDAARIREELEKLRLTQFTAAIFRIGETKLGFEPFGLYADVEVDPEPLLNDMLTGGLYGVVDINRAHSSTITLEAVAAQKTGRRSRGALSSVFLPVSSLSGRYTYLKKHPILLPVAWAQRVFGYLRERRSPQVSASETLRIGRERVDLLKTYKMIE